jgi:hypothetical protein
MGGQVYSVGSHQKGHIYPIPPLGDKNVAYNGILRSDKVA